MSRAIPKQFEVHTQAIGHGEWVATARTTGFCYIGPPRLCPIKATNALIAKLWPGQKFKLTYLRANVHLAEQCDGHHD